MAIDVRIIGRFRSLGRYAIPLLLIRTLDDGSLSVSSSPRDPFFDTSRSVRLAAHIYASRFPTLNQPETLFG